VTVLSNGVRMLFYSREMNFLVSSYILILILTANYIFDDVNSLAVANNYMNTKPTFVGFDLGYGLKMLLVSCVCRTVGTQG
jgi:hypothetical protein